MKILIAADGHAADIYIGALAGGFKKLGHTVSLFTWKGYFHNYPYANLYPTRHNPLASVYYRLQNKFTFGPAVEKLNADLVARAQQTRPDLIFIYRGTHVYPRTLKALKRTGARVFGYNNDDPFSSRYPRYFWRHFRRGLKHYDHVFAYRHKNIADYRNHGARATSLLRAYYVKEQNFPLKNVDKRYRVLFAGHFENDGRDDALKLLRDNGVPLTLFGTDWHLSRHAAVFGGVKPVYGAAYNKALNQADIALCFLSSLNNDTYTRRNFEIPAAGTLMLSQYSADLADNLFKPNTEAVYFKTPQELLKAAQTLLGNPQRVAKIAAAGRARLLKDRHEATDRCRQILQQFLKRP